MGNDFSIIEFFSFRKWLKFEFGQFISFWGYDERLDVTSVLIMRIRATGRFFTDTWINKIEMFLLDV